MSKEYQDLKYKVTYSIGKQEPSRHATDDLEESLKIISDIATEHALNRLKFDCITKSKPEPVYVCSQKNVEITTNYEVKF